MPSNIDPTVPPVDGPLIAAPVRNNFATAQSEITYLQAHTFPEAPTDGHLYARRGSDGTWVAITGVTPPPVGTGVPGVGLGGGATIGLGGGATVGLGGTLAALREQIAALAAQLAALEEKTP